MTKHNSMKKISFFAVFILLAVCFAAPAQVLQKLSGVAVSIDLESHKLHVLFEHPVTGEDAMKIFSVSPSTGFKNAKRLDQIKPNDPVSIDYEESSSDLKAVYIEVIPLKEVPFNKEQVKKHFGFLMR